MKKENFICALEQICSVVDIKESGEFKQTNNESLPFSMQIIRSINSLLINIKEIKKDTIVFQLYYPSNTELYINDIDAEDPTVYILKEGIFQQYSNSLSVVLLTNLSMWIYSNLSLYKTSFKEKGSEYYHFTKNNYNYLCGDRPQINQIYCNTNSFMIFINNDIEYFLVAKDEATLKSMQAQIDEVKNDGKAAKNRKYKLVLNYNFITEPYKLDDGTVQGNIKLGEKDITIKLDTEKEVPLITDFNILARQLGDLLTYFQKDNYDILVYNISSQVVRDIYQQSDITESDLKVECDTFRKNVTLKSIEIFPSGFMLIYDIKFDKEQLFVQLSRTYSIEEITIN